MTRQRLEKRIDTAQRELAQAKAQVRLQQLLLEEAHTALKAWETDASWKRNLREAFGLSNA